MRQQNLSPLGNCNIERMMFVCDKAVPIVDHVNALKAQDLAVN